MYLIFYFVLGLCLIVNIFFIFCCILLFAIDSGYIHYTSYKRQHKISNKEEIQIRNFKDYPIYSPHYTPTL